LFEPFLFVDSCAHLFSNIYFGVAMKTFRRLSRFFFSLMLCVCGASAFAQVEQPQIKVMLDWAVQGTHAPFFVAEKKGYFKQEGFTSVQIDRGAGAGSVINSVAAGAYQIGLSDLSVMVKFNAINPGKALTAYYVYFDETPICLVSLVGKNAIKTAADLNGKRVAAPAGSAIVSTMPILLKATGQTHAKINFINTSPELMPTLLLKGEADAIGGFTNSMIMGIRALGVKNSDLAIFKYSDAGVDMYGLSLMSSHTFVRDNPKTIAAFNRAINRAIKDTIADPKAAIAIVRERDPLLDAGVELERLQIALAQVITKQTRAHGLSSATPERLKRTIETVAESETLPAMPKVEDIYTDKFLPPAADRVIPPMGR
jgi:NitT/TauT family transport system substrate-binding protein